MTVTQKAQTVAKDIAAAPANVVVASITEIQNVLDSVRDLLNTGEASADSLLDTMKGIPPHLVQPILDLLHLSKTAK